ncbi:MAG: histidine kinase [Saprospiraceae bacterium]|nr:histidine kinase [Saprospiraceae bacterium]HMW38769.1 histidine kinase [Saprospiraceae bacterium]HMX88692.1 histidine kinase [Saprospiraceae bacterium]HMZ40124.1 histidine kinase [Saprospiraceae bacterium]HNA64930.1 histidine kinase [Saprospiraceae bacterium]
MTETPYTARYGLRQLIIIINLSCICITWSFATSVVNLNSPDRVFTKKDGLISNNVYGCIQDQKGYLWFYSDKGISKYDGHTFYNYTTHEGLPSSNIWLLTIDSQDRIWVHAHDNQLVYLCDDEVKVYHSFPSQVTIELIIEEANGELLFKSYQSYFYLKNNKIIPHAPTDIICTGKDKLSGFTREFLIGNYKYCYPVNNEFLIIQNIKNCQVKKMRLEVGTNLYTPIIKGDSVIISTSRGQFIFSNGEIISQICIKNSAPINRTFIDRDKNIWVGTRGDGVFLYKNQKNKIEKQFFVFPDQLTNAILYNNFLYCNLKNGQTAVYNIESNSIKGNISTPNLHSIRPFFEDYSILYGDFSHFVSQNHSPFNIHNFFQYFPEWKAKGYVLPFKMIRITHDTVIGIDHFNKLMLYTFSNKTFTSNIIHQDSFRSHDLIYTSKKDIYIASKNNLYQYNRYFQKVRTIPLKNQFDFLNVSVLFYNSITDQILLGTFENGLFSLDQNNKLHQIINTESLDINSLSYCGELLSIFTNKGIYLVNARDTNLKITNVYAASSGIIPEDMLLGFSNDTFIYCVLKDKVIRILPEISKPIKNKISLSKIFCDDIELNLENLKSLSHNSNNLKFSVSLLDYSGAEDVLFAYRLNNYSDWIDLPSNTIHLRDLNPGRHIIEILAKNKYSNAALAITKVPLTINQLWYKTPWFLILCNLLLASLVFYYYNYLQAQNNKVNSIIQKLEYNLRDSQVKLLENQMNPHFIFNSLTSIKSFIQSSDIKNADYYLSHFSKLMRLYLDTSRKSQIAIKEELDLIKHYLVLEKMRFDNRFSYEISIEPQVLENEIQIPTMLIQPIVENSIKHGLFHRPENGLIKIDIRSESAYIVIMISDNGIGMNRSMQLKSLDLTRHDSHASTIVREKINLINKTTDLQIEMSSRELNPNELVYKGTITTITLKQNV